MACFAVTGIAGLLFALFSSAPARAEVRHALFRATAVIKAETVMIEMAITNEGSAPLWVNSRMTVEDESCGPQKGTVHLHVTDKRGRVLHSKCFVNLVRTEKSDYVVLRPGQQISSRYELASLRSLDCFGLELGETIRIEAHYWNSHSPVPPPPAGAVYLGDRLDASPLSFVVP
jgi:hypothetical protein